MKIFEPYQVFMHNFCIKMSKYSLVIYCLQEKLTHFGLEVSVEYIISSLYVLNCFEYFLINVLGQMSQKDQTRRFF